MASHMSMSKPTYLSPCLNSNGTKAVSVATIRSSACDGWIKAMAAAKAVTRRLLSFIVLSQLGLVVVLSVGPRRGRDACNRRIDRGAEALDDAADVGSVRDEGRGQQHVVAEPTVDGSAHRVDDQAACHGFRFDSCIQLQRRIERPLGGSVGDHLHAAEQAATAYVADVMVIAQPLQQPVLELGAHRHDVG